MPGKLLVSALVIVVIMFTAFAFFVPTIQSSSPAGAGNYCAQVPSIAFCGVQIPLGIHHYDSLSMWTLGFGASSAGFLGSGVWYSLNS